MEIHNDDGYYFGLGVFETIAVENRVPLFLKEHLRRLKAGMENLHIRPESEQNLSEAYIQKKCSEMPKGRQALKITVSPGNLVFTTRENPYYREQYLAGVHTVLTDIRRNESSPLTYIKSLNCGDSILAKRAGSRCGISEPLFLNTRGELAEGAVTNVFMVKGNRLFTPPIRCGLLPGILRNFLINNYDVTEQIILPEEVADYDEMFLTNSLMGIMPVKSFGSMLFSSRKYGLGLSESYFHCHNIEVEV